ncbi:MAG: ABC transporter ATP-binding protein [Calditrichaeota bacterium]|nr:MAG: ABC transporter ATP-binding protein [Calditrichota bacterium]
MVHLKGISFSIGERRLIDDIDWIIPNGSRFALIGPNGTGKTTLFRIITQNLSSQSGVLLKPKEYTIGFLPQEEIEFSDSTILHSAMQGKAELLRLAAEIDQLRIQVEQPGHSENLLKKLGEMEHQFDSWGGYSLEAQAKAVLSGLGFGKDDMTRSLREFSGGWRMRVYLARLLLLNPDLLLLDEPTNHLDLTALEWLEQYLANFGGSIIIISHDRYFIDRLAREIFELVHGRLKHYAGNYHYYEQQKVIDLAQTEAKIAQLSRERSRQQAFIDRFRYKATKATQVQSRLKMLNRLEDIDHLPVEHRYSFKLSVSTESYLEVLTFKNVTFAYDTPAVLDNIDLEIYRGQKIALVGDNGAGKTTLTRLIVGQLSPQFGQVTLGQRVKIAYYAQHQIEALDFHATVYDQVASTVADVHLPRIRDVLGLFGFHGDDVFKPISVLSGGEKARVSLTQILLSPVNFLIMDEPTNHLDIASREALENALVDFNGTLLLISHDRYFLDKIVNRVIEVHDRALTGYEGNYTDYLNKRMFSAQQTIAGKSETPIGRRLKDEKRKEAELRQSVSQKRRELNAEIENCESNIDQLEKRKVVVESLLGVPDTYKNGDQAASLTREYHQIKDAIEEWLRKWETTSSMLEELLRSLE